MFGAGEKTSFANAGFFQVLLHVRAQRRIGAKFAARVGDQDRNAINIELLE
jgi:hypothetical protein